MEWKYFKKDGRVIGKWQPSEERIQEYLDNGYELCDKDGCECVGGAVVFCEEPNLKNIQSHLNQKKVKSNANL